MAERLASARLRGLNLRGMNLKRIAPFFLPAALAVAAACASTASNNNNFPTSGSSGTLGTSGNSTSGTFVSSGSSGSFGGGLSGSPLSSSDAELILDGNVALASNGAGTTIVGRTCDPTCDELQEPSPLGHTYVEPHPDDGSPLPPSNAASLFSGTASTTGGPCIHEPQDGSLFPNNWLRPRIYFTAPTGQIYQIRIHADRQSQDLVVYTESQTWELPNDIWRNLAASTWSEDITVTVEAVAPSGGTPTISAPVHFQIAPANANGSMIYWATVDTHNGDGWLEGFGVGDDNVATALTVPQVQSRASHLESGGVEGAGAAPGAPICIGCHVAVPDTNSVVFNDGWPWDGVASMVDPQDTGKVPPWLTPGGQSLLSMPWMGMVSFSPHLWNDMNQHLMVAAYQGCALFPTPFPSYDTTDLLPDGGPPAGVAPYGYNGSNECDDTQMNSSTVEVTPAGGGQAYVATNLIWMDLSTPAAPATPVNGTAVSVVNTASSQLVAEEGTAWGFIARNGDSLGVVSPTWSHVGDRIVYASTNAAFSGRLGSGVSALWAVPFNGGAGGAAAPLPGVAAAGFNDFYPTFSPDDQYVAFNRAPAADNMYNDPNDEIYVTPGAGGAPVRLAANDPPACTGVKSPGITNTWPKWSPEYPRCNGQTYYWLVFSSSRAGVKYINGTSLSTQIYLTGMVDNGAGSVTTYPGIFIWNQHLTSSVTAFMGQSQSNRTPQWEPINLPTPPPPIMPPPPPR